MKKYLASILMLLAFGSASAADCKDLADYQVSQTTFSRIPLKTAIDKLLVGTPYRSEIIGGDDVKISANAIGGPLSGVLTSLSTAAKFSFEVKSCVVIIRLDNAAVSPVKMLGDDTQGKRVWKVSVGDNYGQLLTKWAQTAGVLLYWEAPPLISEGQATLNETFEDAVTKVISALNAGGARLKPLMYEDGGNRYIRIIERNN